VRAGANNIQRISGFSTGNELNLQPSLGIGIKFRSISLDYALTNAGNQGGSKYSNIFTIRWSFDSLKH
jgi:hypothetical protein